MLISDDADIRYTLFDEHLRGCPPRNESSNTTSYITSDDSSPRWTPVTVPLNQNGTAAFILTLTTQSNNSNDASLSGRMSPKCSEDLNRRCGLTRTLMLFGFWFSSFVFWMACSIASTTGSSKLLFPHLTGSRLSVGTVFNQSWTSDKDPLSPATKSFAKYWSSC